jgi:lipoate-protein ligase B
VNMDPMFRRINPCGYAGSVTQVVDLGGRPT